MKRKRNFSVRKGKKNKVGIKKGLGIKKLTRKDKETLEEYGTLNPTELEESESDETEGSFSKGKVFTEDQFDEERNWEEDEMMNEISDGETDDDDESFEELYLDKPDSSYRKLVGLLQVNKNQKLDEVVVKEVVEIDKVKGKIDDVEINLKDEGGENNIKSEGDNNNDYDQEQNAKDEFERHFGNQQILNGKVSMIEQKKWNIINYENSVLNTVSKYTLNNEENDDNNESDMKNLNSLKIRPKLLETWKKVNDNTFTDLQWHLFQQFNKYRDVLYTNRIVEDSHKLKCVYALHALNHIFKVRNRVLKSNEKLNNAHAAGKDIDEIRDQGFTRPKVLILLPFRNSAMDLVEILIKLSGTDQQENRKRFFESFGITSEQEKIDPKKPADFLATFKGNIDDMFRIGIKFTRKSMKFYAEFYNADIIIASPLGLRMIIGAEGDKKRDFDFLSSIEIMIVDQCDTLLMQNWDYVEHIFSHMNLIPQKSHDCDFSRVKEWYLDGRAKYLRQTIVFADYLTPEINALFNKQMNNVDGKIKIKHHHKGTILDVNATNIRQTFTRIECNLLSEVDDLRFKYFTEKVLPKIRKMNLSHVMIFIPSYFDFVRLRNYFEDNSFSFTSINEYASVSDVTRARTYFLNGKKNYLLYTERFHFFRRNHIKGIHHIIFYALPDHAHFYSELLNFIQLSPSNKTSAIENSNEMISISVLFSKFDQLRLERVVGTSKFCKMLQGEKKVYTFSN